MANIYLGSEIISLQKHKFTIIYRSYELVGATSFGRQCALAGFPGVYADVFREFQF